MLEFPRGSTTYPLRCRGRGDCAARLGGDDHQLNATERAVGQHGHLIRVKVSRAKFWGWSW